MKIAQWQAPDHFWVSFLTTGRILERPQGLSPESLTLLESFLGPLGCPQIHKKSILRPKRGPRDRCLMHLCTECCFSNFGDRFFINFWWKIDEKIMYVLKAVCACFSTWRTLEFIDRRGVLSTFCFYHSFENYGTIAQKTEQNSDPQKTSKNEPRGLPKWIQNGLEFVGKVQKISKMAPKVVFLIGRFFDYFLGC